MDIENLHIEFSVQDLTGVLYFLNFVQKYGRFNSPFFPVFVSWSEFPPTDYLFLEANDDPLQEPIEIAKMSFMTLASESKVIIEVIGEGRNRWYTVEKIVKAVLEDLWNKGYRINSVLPRGLFHPTKIVYSKKELIGKNIYIEGELFKGEEIHNTPGSSEEGNQSDLEESSSKGSINSSVKTKSLEILNGVDPESVVKKYGTDRDLTLSEVKDIVARCKEFQHKNGTIQTFYNDVLSPSMSDKFSLETLKSWLKDKKFKP